MRPEPTLDCQTCGTELRTLTRAEAQRVAHDPYAFVVFCGPCGRLETQRLERER
jgi:hypothetical protein